MTSDDKKVRLTEYEAPLQALHNNAVEQTYHWFGMHATPKTLEVQLFHFPTSGIRGMVAEEDDQLPVFNHHHIEVYYDQKNNLEQLCKADQKLAFTSHLFTTLHETAHTLQFNSGHEDYQLRQTYLDHRITIELACNLYVMLACEEFEDMQLVPRIAYVDRSAVFEYIFLSTFLQYHNDYARSLLPKGIDAYSDVMRLYRQFQDKQFADEVLVHLCPTGSHGDPLNYFKYSKTAKLIESSNYAHELLAQANFD